MSWCIGARVKKVFKVFGKNVDAYEEVKTTKHHSLGAQQQYPLLCLSHEKVSTHSTPFEWWFVKCALTEKDFLRLLFCTHRYHTPIVDLLRKLGAMYLHDASVTLLVLNLLFTITIIL